MYYELWSEQMNLHKIKPPQMIAIGFLSIIALGTILLIMPFSSASGQFTSLINALFTATSAVCVTGLTVVETSIYWSGFGQLIILLLIQVGGLGFMTSATLFALLLGKKIGLRSRIVLQESHNMLSLTGVVRLARMMIIFSLTIEAVAAFILWLRWGGQFGWLKSAWLAIFHAVSAFNNAGFDLFAQFNGGGTVSLLPFVADPLVIIVIGSLIVFGGLGFAAFMDIYKARKFSKLELHTKVVLITTATLLTIGFLGIMALELTNPATLGALSWKGKFLAAFFQSITARTAGFFSINLAAAAAQTQMLIIILMFIGASPNSTGGGIKTTTFAVIILGIWALIRGKESVVIFERSLQKEQILRAMFIAMISFLLLITTVFILLIFEPFSLMQILFEATSAFATVGLSLGITADLHTISKAMLVFTMYAGRIGPLTLAIALAAKSMKRSIKYPEEKIIIG